MWFEASVYGAISEGDPRAAWLGFVAAVTAAIVGRRIAGEACAAAPRGIRFSRVGRYPLVSHRPMTFPSESLK